MPKKTATPPADELPKRRASGPSGRSKTHAARQAEGLVRLVVWLSPEEDAALEAKRKGRSRRDTIRALLLGRQTK